MLKITDVRRAVAELRHNEMFKVFEDYIVEKQATAFEKLMYQATSEELPALQGELRAYQELLKMTSEHSR